MTTDTEYDVAQPDISPVWYVSANVREDIPFGEGATETRHGTNKFHAGAKVYVANPHWGTVAVVGHYRGKGYITCFLNTRYLTNWRVELVDSPAIIARLKKERYWAYYSCDGSVESKTRAEQLAERLRKDSDEHHAERLAKRNGVEEAKLRPSGNGYRLLCSRLRQWVLAFRDAVYRGRS